MHVPIVPSRFHAPGLLPSLRRGRFWTRLGQPMTGELAPGWKTSTLGEVCAFLNRGSSPKYLDEGGVCVLGQRCVRNHRIDYRPSRRHDVRAKAVGAGRFVEIGDVLVNSTGVGSLGRVAQVRDTPLEPTTVDSHVTIVRPIPGMFFADFFGYMLMVIEDAITDAGEGCGGQTELGRRVLAERFSVRYPKSLDEQQRIAGILDEAFEGIAMARENAEKNLRNARALSETALTAAVGGALTADWRRTSRTSAGACRPLSDERSWRGRETRAREPRRPVVDRPVEMPDSWALATPEAIATHIVDCPHSTPRWTHSGVACLRTTNFRAGFLDLESLRFVSEETYQERIARLEPEPGDVLYSREGGILGLACIMPPSFKACLGQRMMQLRLDSLVVLPEYFASVLNSSLILSQVTRLTGGAAAPHLNIRDIKAFPIPLPPLSEQRVIVAMLARVNAEIQRLEVAYRRKLAALDELKRSLLHQACSGQL